MIISYEKLRILLKRNNMKKKDRAVAANVTSYTMTKLNKDLPVSMETMVKFCKIFHCDIGDLMQVIETELYSGGTIWMLQIKLGLCLF